MHHYKKEKGVRVEDKDCSGYRGYPMGEYPLDKDIPGNFILRIGTKILSATATSFIFPIYSKILPINIA